MLTITEVTLIAIFLVISMSCATLGAILFFVLRAGYDDSDGMDYEKMDINSIMIQGVREDADIIDYLNSLEGRRN